MNTDRQMLATQFAQAVNRLGMLALLPQEHENPTQVQLDQWREEAFEVEHNIEFLLEATKQWAEENIRTQKANAIHEAGVNKE